MTSNRSKNQKNVSSLAHSTRTMTTTTATMRLSRATAAAPQLTQRHVRVAKRSFRAAPVAMAPFKNPFKAKPKEDKGPGGVRVLLETVKKGRAKAETEGFQTVLADVRDGITQRNYGEDPESERSHPRVTMYP